MVQKKEEGAPDLVVRLRKAMDAGFSLRHIISECGLSQYRVNVIVKGIPGGRVAGGAFNHTEDKSISDYLETAKRAVTVGLGANWVAGLDAALRHGVTMSSVCRSVGITVPQFRYRLNRCDSDEEVMSLFDDKEQNRIAKHLQKLADSL